ncbi:UDP-N-acetylmuramoylalanine--D-glutamate ligase [Thermoactinomyces sp. DSM 45891]|uniref:UDP-N-acetylmuramoyl-L-alanine--D-glutamate ligase n=1 Tax=Thermoactinomyces sp. DSM 45891 TaxID=1761907 RepID=UPI000919BF45|nr:UDP-N-acetylmuramoyl-L-alanine--D-glutamate ligase [Thermoactinomyces sp. DSM 45891]SFX26948.1 UDP-N-acetylmuramoylalanine--D-glutamate ligase [Thermoactinomyces sp. DSM 45891]
MTDLFQDKHVVVLGLARSGLAVAKLLIEQGAKVTVNDARERIDCANEADPLEQMGISVICGGHPDDLIDQQIDLVVKNPGIPYHIKPIQQALKLEIPVVTEVEIASQFSKAPIIGITGSNGKTTTTTLVGKMLQNSGVSATVAGNIGQALSEVTPQLSKNDWLVAELSSFQLKGTVTFRPKIAALLNVTPAHMDYHQTMEDYVVSKWNLFQNQTPDDVAILNADSAICRDLAGSGNLKSRVIWFSKDETTSQGVYIKDGWITSSLDGNEIAILPVEEVALPGLFNLENVLAATAISIMAGADIERIAETIRTFCGVEHRLEYVEMIEGVRYYNDSKATNVQAALTALTSFEEPIVWIAGGLDRGVDFQELTPVLSEHVQAVIAYGESAPILALRAKEAGIESIIQVDDVEEAVYSAHEISRFGDVVVLSPACASWDLYNSFEQRGSIFKQAVHRLV